MVSAPSVYRDCGLDMRKRGSMIVHHGDDEKA